MSSQRLVSLILPVFQGEQTLGAALESIRRQTVRDWDCWVVDDGSTDRTAEIVSEFAQKDPRFRLLPRPHEGIVSSLNAGISHAEGRFVGRMDADDLMRSNRLELQLDLLARERDLVGVGAHVRISPRSTLRQGARAYESWLNSHSDRDTLWRDRFVECPLAHPTWMMRGDIVRRFPYEDRDWPEDYDLLLRLFQKGHKLGVVPRRLLTWRDRPARLQRSDARYAESAFVACKAHYLSTGPLAHTDRYILWGHGGTGRRIKRALTALGRSPSAIVELHPGRLGNNIDGAPVIAPEQLAQLGGEIVLASVAGAQPRAQIRAALAQMGRVDGKDFFCVA